MKFYVKLTKMYKNPNGTIIDINKTNLKTKNYE